MSRLEIRVHPEEGWIAVRDRPDSDRPWAKVVPGVSLADDDVADWMRYEPATSRYNSHDQELTGK